MKNIIKYILLAVFVFMQVQAFAFNNSSDLWKKVSLKEETNWLLFSNKGNSNTVVFKPEFFAEGNNFSLTSEVISGGCYSGNANTKKIRFTLKNVSGQQISVVDQVNNGMKLRLELNNLSKSSIEFLQGSFSLSTLNYVNQKTFANDETIIFDVNYNSDTSDSVTGKITLTYGYANSSLDISTPLDKFDESNIVLKTPSAPTNSTTPTKLHSETCYTIIDAFELFSGLTDLNQIGSFKFYYNDVLLSLNTLIKFNSENKIAIGVLNTNGNVVYDFQSVLNLKYSKTNNACESPKSDLKFEADTSTKPLPGSIQQTATVVCYGNSVTFSNSAEGNRNGTATSVSSENYSWEVSYNNGECWETVVNSSLTVIDSPVINPQNTTLTLNNISQNVKVRRKFKVGITSTYMLNYSYTQPLSVEVYNNEIYLPNDWSVYYVKTGETLIIPQASTKFPSTVVLRNSSNEIASYSFTAPNTTGEHTFNYTATAIPGEVDSGFSPFACVTTKTITIVVYDTASCDFTKKRTFATIAKPWTSGLSGVANPNNAVNGDRAQYATITGGVVLLGLGTVGIDLYFTKPDGSLYTGAELRGKKVIVKLGEQYSGLKLAGGVTITGRLTHSGVTASNVRLANASSVGSTFGVKGGVLDLLKGDNVFEYSFIPADGLSNGTPVDYNGIRIQLGSLLGVADLATVFYAFIEEEVLIDATNDPCGDLSNQILVSPPASLQYPTTQKGFTIVNTNFALNPFVEDVFWGNYTEVLNVASGLSSVVFPYYAVDNNYNSYAIFNTTAGVLNKQFINVKLRREARPGDKVQIVIGTEGINVLNLSLLNLVDYKVKFYRGDTEVGSITLDRFKVLDLGLLGFSNTQKAIISAPVSGIFDRVQLEQWNTVSVNLGNEFYVYDVRVNPTSAFAGQTDTKTVTSLCATDYIKIQKSDFCTDYEVSFAEATFDTNLQLRDELGNLLNDLDGNPIYSISAVTDISNSSLGNPIQVKDNIAYYEVNRLFTEVGNRLLLKIQTKRYGCNYGDPQYLRVRLTNCESAIVNPVINSSANY